MEQSWSLIGAAARAGMWVFWEDAAYSCPCQPRVGEDTILIRSLIQPGPYLKQWQSLEWGGPLQYGGWAARVTCPR